MDTSTAVTSRGNRATDAAQWGPSSSTVGFAPTVVLNVGVLIGVARTPCGVAPRLRANGSALSKSAIVTAGGAIYAASGSTHP
jgi:hypothetical protein